MNTPEWLINTMPAVGILGLASSACYLYIMHKTRMDAYIMYYGLALIDVLFALSLVYAGFHGIIVMAKGNNDNATIRPIECLSQAIHVSLWYYFDVINLLIIVILCLDQVVSVIWSKTHSDVSRNYFKMPILILILFAGTTIFIPVWNYSITNSNNTTVKVSSFCHMSEIVYDKVYSMEMDARRWVPLGGMAFLCLTSIILLSLQLRYHWDFKWTDSNSNAQCMFFFVLLRCLLTIISVHLPIILLNAQLQSTSTSKTANNNNSEMIQQNTNKIEYFIRFSQGILFGIIQPILSMRLLPKYWEAIKKFWNQYAHNTKRDWQSVDDPPVNKNSESSDPVFGSWYSSGGNINGEAGVPNVYDAARQKSISFYCNEMDPNN